MPDQCTFRACRRIHGVPFRIFPSFSITPVWEAIETGNAQEKPAGDLSAIYPQDNPPAGSFRYPPEGGLEGL
jgi:hypothetical protein